MATRSGEAEDAGVPGSCLCGRVRFRASMPSLFCAHCHCSLCRRSHGAGFVTWFGVSKEALRISDGESELVRFRSSDHGTRAFCGVCGSSLFFETSLHPERVDIVLANMHAPIDREPHLNVFVDHRAPWVKLDESLTCLGGESGFEPH